MNRLPLVLSLALFGSGAAAQVLDCPGSANPARPCETFHYHVSYFRSDPKGLVDAWGTNQYATQAACERAREEQVRRNLAVVTYWHSVRNEQQYEPDRIGPCHCDMTMEKSNPRYLSDAQRIAQIRTVEDLRERVRERLLDSGLKSDNELVRNVTAPLLIPNSVLGGAKTVAPPRATAAAPVINSPSDLRATKAIDTTKPIVSPLDLPLVEIPVTAHIAAEMPSAPASGSTVTITAPVPSTTAKEGKGEDVAPAVSVKTETSPPRDIPAPAVSAEERASAEEAVEGFISYESERIQNVLKASSAVVDDAVKTRIYEAVQQRIQLLSNLRDLITAAGMRSRLAAGARNAKSEEERLAFVTKLFGADMTSHWAPKDASDVILDADPAVESNPEGALRDTSGRFTEQQKRRALYLLLARSQPTEEQQLWLTTVADTFLR